MIPEYAHIVAADHVEQLRRAAQRAPRPRKSPVDMRDLELRLCRVGDELQLEHLAELDERPVPAGRLVVAAVGGRIVVALPLAGGPALRDPFTRTEHLMPLVELRAAQLREPEPRRGLIPRYVSLMRGSIHA